MLPKVFTVVVLLLEDIEPVPISDPPENKADRPPPPPNSTTIAIIISLLRPPPPKPPLLEDGPFPEELPPKPDAPSISAKSSCSKA